MKAFTITTKHPEWEELTRECVARAKRHLGVDLEVLDAKDQYDSHLQKLLHPLRHHDEVWFFDSDWWALQDAKLLPVPIGGMRAVYCRTAHERYCNTCVDLKKVFGTTLYAADMRSPQVRSAFMHAVHLQHEAYWNGKPKADESFLNIACQQRDVHVAMMGFEWNHCAKPDASTIGLHAGGMWPKLAWMREMLGGGETK